MKLSIKEIRSVIKFCDWSRNDLGGSTQAEFQAMDVKSQLQPRINAVKSLVIPTRYAEEIAQQAFSITAAEKTIARWESMQ
jgi:hypothetical protein